jgi:putative membrane protein
MKFILRLLITGIALAVISYFSWFGVHASTLTALLEGAVLLGLLNALIKPILLVVSCPLEILTLGLFTLVINALIFLCLRFIPGWTVPTFWDAFWAAIVMSILSWILSIIFGERRDDRAKSSQQR